MDHKYLKEKLKLYHSERLSFIYFTNNNGQAATDLANIPDQKHISFNP